MFSRKGYISVDKSSSDEDTIMTLALENGADDFSVEDEIYEIYTKPEQTETVKNALAAKNIQISNSEVSMIPQTYVKLTGEDAEHMIKLMDELEEYDDVKNVFANFDISKEDMEKFSV